MRGIASTMMVAVGLCLAACGGENSDGGAEAPGSTSTAMAEPTSTGVGPTGSEGGPETGGESGVGTGSEGDTGAGTSTGGEQATMGLPEGVSTWTGQGEINSLIFLFDLTITNNGGDLTATATLKEDPELPIGLGSPEFALSGTHEPTSGKVALAPNDWIVMPDVNVELIGLEVLHDPGAKTLTGMLVDFAKGTENYLLGGAVSLTLVDGPGEATIRGDESRSLAVGSQRFTGQIQCTGPVRETEVELVYDGIGGLTGSLTVGDPGLDTPIGAFTVTGVHNPSTGGITLVPGLWIDDQGTVLTFYIDGTFDPMTGSFNGDQWTNTAACPTGTWMTSLQ